MTERAKIQIDTSEGEKTLKLHLSNLRSTVLQFPEKLSASEWTEKHGRLQRETSADPGEVRLYGYQRGILDAMSDPSISQITVCKSARVGYTALVGFAIGYFLEHEAASVLFAQPTDDDAKDWSKTSFDPMVRDTPALKSLLRTPSKGQPLDTWSDMQFRNGSVLKVRGAASDDAFRRISTRINIGDEVDADAWRNDRKGSQGDKIRLMRTRGDTFWNGKTIIGSTPLWSHSSRIWREFQQSDQRRYHVPCPHCGAMQVLKWGGQEVRFGIKWMLDDDGAVADAWYVCEHCDERIDEKQKSWMDANGEWIATAKPRRPGHAGFHIWTGQSLFAKAGWKYLVEEWLDAQRKPELLQPFVNLRLGEPYEDRKEHRPEINIDEVADDLEVYDAEVPAPVVLLTAGCDVQSGEDNNPDKPARVEVSIWGWGRGEESWLIGHHVINGAMDQPATQAELDELLTKAFRKADGTELFVQAASIDMGGHYTEAVRDFARRRVKRHVWSIKGKNLRLGTRSPSVWPKKASRNRGDTWYMIDTQLAKDIIGRRFRIKSDGPGRIHFNADVSDKYLRGLASETLVTDSAGRRYWKKENAKAYGEPLDCFVYAYAALCGLKMSFKRWSDIDKVADAMNIPKERSEVIKASEAPERTEIKPAKQDLKQPVQQSAPLVKPRPKVRVGSSFMSRR